MVNKKKQGEASYLVDTPQLYSYLEKQLYEYQKQNKK